MYWALLSGLFHNSFLIVTGVRPGTVKTTVALAFPHAARGAGPIKRADGDAAAGAEAGVEDDFVEYLDDARLLRIARAGPWHAGAA